jgi:hypothetical protein
VKGERTVPDESAVYPPALFLYQVTPTAVPYSEPGLPSTVNLMFFVSNTSGHDVEVDQIVFDLRLGPEPGDLTVSDDLDPQPVVGPDWHASGIGDGRVRVEPRAQAPFRGLRADESLGVVVPGVVVNSQQGVANLPVWESSDELRQSYVSVAKTPPGLAINSFQASPVQLGRQHPSSILSWEVSGASLVTLSHNGGTEQVKADGFKEVAPRVTTLYTLTATGAGQATHEQLTVYVPRVALISFGADPALIAGGQSSTLRWSLLHATEAIILASGDEPDPGPASLPEGELTVAPRQPATTYTLTAGGFGNVVTGLAQVDYVPTVERFSVTPEQAPRDAGLPLTVAWKVRDIANVSISGLPDPQPNEGSAVVRPKQTTSYTLSAKRLVPSRTVQAHLAGQITKFEVSVPGKTIRWNGSGGDAARLAINNIWHTVPFTSGSSYAGNGSSTLEMISKQADWVNRIEARIISVPPSSAVVSAASDYGLNAAGAIVTVNWSIGPGQRIMIRNGSGSVMHDWPTADGPQTFIVPSASSRIVWQLVAPGTTWIVYAGEPWASAAADGTEAASRDGSDDRAGAADGAGDRADPADQGRPEVHRFERKHKPPAAG